MNKRHIHDTRPNNFSDWRASPPFHGSVSLCFPTLLSFFLANSSSFPGLGGQSCFVVGGEWQVPFTLPWRVMSYMQTMTSLLSSVENVFSIWQRATLFHLSFCWVQPYSLVDPTEISGPLCGVRSHCLVCVKLLWWEPQRWTHKQ